MLNCRMVPDNECQCSLGELGVDKDAVTAVEGPALDRYSLSGGDQRIFARRILRLIIQSLRHGLASDLPEEQKKRLIRAL